jgi:hypothetical protein
MFFRLFHKIEMEEMLSNSFHKASVAIILKPDTKGK